MPRRRMIDPQIWSDRKLMQTSETARILFIGMFSHADDEGRLPADVTDLKREIFGYNDTTAEEIEAALAELQSACKSLCVYKIAGERYVAFRKWKKYQYVQAAKPSDIVAPPIATEDPLSDSSDNDKQTITERSVKGNGLTTDEYRPNRSKESRNKGSKKGVGVADDSPPDPDKPDPHPGRTLFREVFDKYPKVKHNDALDEQFRILGEEEMRRRLEYWEGHGWNKTNYLGILEVLKNGCKDPPRRGATNEPPGPPVYKPTY